MKTNWNLALAATALAAALTLVACSTATDTGNGGGGATGPAASVITVSATAATAVGTAGAATGPTVEAGWTRYEAESTPAVMVLGSAEAQGFYSNGSAAGSLNTHTVVANIATDWSNVSCVKFTLAGLTAGTYDLRIGYNGDDNKIIVVSGNGSAPTTVSLPNITSGHDWNQLLRKDLTATFSAGDNTFWVSGTVLANAGDTPNWANIDYIEIKKQ